MSEHANKNQPFEVTTAIELRTCTIREARNVDRRFSFEIVGPYIGRRVYQATDAESFKAWMAVIQNVIEGLLDGTSSFFERDPIGGEGSSPREGLNEDAPRVCDLIREADALNNGAFQSQSVVLCLEHVNELYSSLR